MAPSEGGIIIETCKKILLHKIQGKYPPYIQIEEYDPPYIHMCVYMRVGKSFRPAVRVRRVLSRAQLQRGASSICQKSSICQERAPYVKKT